MGFPKDVMRKRHHTPASVWAMTVETQRPECRVITRQTWMYSLDKRRSIGAYYATVAFAVGDLVNWKLWPSNCLLERVIRHP